MLTLRKCSFESHQISVCVTFQIYQEMNVNCIEYFCSNVIQFDFPPVQSHSCNNLVKQSLRLYKQKLPRGNLEPIPCSDRGITIQFFYLSSVLDLRCMISLQILYFAQISPPMYTHLNTLDATNLNLQIFLLLISTGKGCHIRYSQTLCP